jgi:hypothetical protein
LGGWERLELSSFRKEFVVKEVISYKMRETGSEIFVLMPREFSSYMVDFEDSCGHRMHVLKISNWMKLVQRTEQFLRD